jgi:hypothetical protein
VTCAKGSKRLRKFARGKRTVMPGAALPAASTSLPSTSAAASACKVRALSLPGAGMFVLVASAPRSLTTSRAYSTCQQL